MTRQVSASVYAGGYTVDELERYRVLHERLTARGTALAAAAQRWGRVAMTTADARTRLRWCPAAAGSSCVDHADPTPVVTGVLDACETTAARMRALADACARLADLVARAHGLYAQAESDARRAADRAIATLTFLAPRATGLAAGALAAGGLAYGLVTQGELSLAHASKATAWAQEGLMAGFGARMSGSLPLSSGTVGDAARTIGTASSIANDAIQGDRLRVRAVDVHGAPVTAVDGVQSALRGLHALGRANAADGDDPAYGTIAISRYAREDGSTAWLVTIPGTDGHLDSPFGWEQNLELMSSDAAQRRDADSARMVVQAMRQAGVGADDPVALVGHSQGGIVAATIASDYADSYDVRHIVTAGSPIANHPVAQEVWVTSVEMDDELVAALDGGANPMRERWLTVRGTLSEDGDGGLLTGCAIEGDDGAYRLTHDLAYHEAAWRHADALSAPAVRAHDEHLRETLDGRYLGTTYWRGRMERE